jgi:hypothetical protein
MGSFVSSGILNSSHIFEAPPVFGLNISVSHLQCGQVNPDMFSTTPIIGISVLMQKLISFLTSNSDISCGVVTTIAPFIFVFFRYCIIDRCSSDVPGGAIVKVYTYCQ